MRFVVIKTEIYQRAILSLLGLKSSLSKIPISSNTLFQKYKMDEMIKKFLLAGNRFMLEMHLRQPRVTYR